PPPSATLVPYTTLFRSRRRAGADDPVAAPVRDAGQGDQARRRERTQCEHPAAPERLSTRFPAVKSESACRTGARIFLCVSSGKPDRKSTRLNSSHVKIS